jgi:putative RecB family exonuclease
MRPWRVLVPLEKNDMTPNFFCHIYPKKTRSLVRGDCFALGHARSVPKHEDETLDATTTPAMSHTRVKQWEQCAMAYKLKYLDHSPAQRIECLDLGIVVHRALELLVGQAMSGQERLTHAAAQACLDEAWAQEKATGCAQYTDAKAMVERFVDEEANLELDNVLGVEQAFRIDAGGTKLAGVMDRIDRVDADTIEIIDYKTGVMIPTAEDLASNLQLTLYQHVAQTLWPWAKHVRLTLHMVRHGIKLHTTRTSEQVADALKYVGATAQQIATAAKSGDYPCTLSAACGTCLYRLSCPAYRALLTASEAVHDAAPRSLEMVASQREHMSALAKAADARKRELDVILRQALDEQDEVVAAGRRYTIRHAARRSYPVVTTLARLSATSNEPAMALSERLTSISNSRLSAYLKSIEEQLPKLQVTMLRLELDATAETSFVPQIVSKSV